MKINVDRLFLALLFLAPAIGFSQDRSIKSKIVAFNKYPIENITVVAKKSKAVTKTGVDGSFSLEVKKNDVVQIKNPLFMRHDIKITSSDHTLRINLNFIESGQNVNRAIEEGYFNRDDLVYALENLVEENNFYSPFATVYDSIRNAVPEAAMMERNNGKKGFVPRGTNSLKGNNNAIDVVNGSVTRDISNFAPSEIRRIYKLSNS